MLPGTSLDGARILVDRCRAHIAEARPCDGAITATFGVIEAVAGETAEQITARINAAINTDRAR